jgi:hypothetical protein
MVYLGVAACIAAIGVNASSLLFPFIFYDDFDILQESYTWESTCARLWVPFNEHCWPLTRLYAWMVVQLAGSPTGLPFTTAIAARVMQFSAMFLVGLFVQRERGDAFLGFVAAIVFGVSSVYQEAVYWFAATPAVAAAATALLGLLAAQRWLQTGRGSFLVWSAFWCALAPGWFAGGVLAGPLCGLYLAWGKMPGRRWLAIVPVLGSLAFLAISMPLAGKQILHTPHYGERSAVEAFAIVEAVANTGRSIVDNLVLGAVGVTWFTCPVEIAAAGAIALAALLGWWWKRAPNRRLIVLGLAFILLSDFLVYGARANHPYDVQLRYWSRYNVWPWLGTVLIVCGGLSPSRRPKASLKCRDQRSLGWLMAILLAVQLPQGIYRAPAPNSLQAEALEKVARMDERCRARGVAAADASRVLPPLAVPGNPDFNGWLSLRGSENASPLPDAEVRRRLLDK